LIIKKIRCLSRVFGVSRAFTFVSRVSCVIVGGGVCAHQGGSGLNLNVVTQLTRTHLCVWLCVCGCVSLCGWSGCVGVCVGACGSLCVCVCVCVGLCLAWCVLCAVCMYLWPCVLRNLLGVGRWVLCVYDTLAKQIRRSWRHPCKTSYRSLCLGVRNGIRRRNASRQFGGNLNF